MTRLYTVYNEIMSDVTRVMGQPVRTLGKLSSLERRGNRFKRILVEKFNERRDYRLFALGYHFLDQMVEEIPNFKALPFLDSSS